MQFEQALIEHGALTLAGLKPASLFRFLPRDESRFIPCFLECREELGVTVQVGEPFMEVTHQYPDITVHLTLFHASSWISTEPKPFNRRSNTVGHHVASSSTDVSLKQN